MVIGHGSLVPEHQAADESVLAVFLFDDPVKAFTSILVEVISLVLIVDPAGLHEARVLIEEILLAFNDLKS